MGSVRVLFFGPAQDAAGGPSTTVALAASMTLGALIDNIMIRHPALGRARASLRFAVNGEFAKPDRLLSAGDEIAVIPPVSGGQEDCDLIELVDGPIDAARVRGLVGSDPGLGGVVSFEGATRFERHPTRGDLLRLEYQVYAEMALAQMRRLAVAARERWPIGRLAIVHRTGLVEPAGVSVMIAVACPHRAEAFEACRWLIDSLKKEVPIWKREMWADGHSTWVDPTRGEVNHADTDSD